MTLDMGRSDHDVGRAIWEMKDALNAMIDATTMTGARGAEIDRLASDDLAVSLSLSRSKIQEEFDRLRKAAFRVGGDPEPVVWGQRGEPDGDASAAVLHGRRQPGLQLRGVLD